MGSGGGLLGDTEYFVGILKMHKLFLPTNRNLIFIALHLSEKKLSITSGKQSKQVENTPSGWSMFNKCNI